MSFTQMHSFLFISTLIAVASGAAITSPPVEEAPPVPHLEKIDSNNIPFAVRLSRQDRFRTNEMREICTGGFREFDLLQGCGKYSNVFQECRAVGRVFYDTASVLGLEEFVTRGCPKDLGSIDNLEDFANKANGNCKKYKNKCDDNDDGGSKEVRECSECARTCLEAYNENNDNASMAAALFCVIQPFPW